eukprot:m.294551 g.294551  ORF g.294551 m.294551 type:complete len:488 (+) comp13012_c0_seq1:1081-2544(+)
MAALRSSHWQLWRRSAAAARLPAPAASWAARRLLAHDADPSSTGDFRSFSAPPIALSEYQERRERLVARMLPRSVAIVPGAGWPLMSADVHYRFRQDTELSYLCPESRYAAALLVHVDDAGVARTTAVVPPRDPDRELWDGRRLSLDEAVAAFGVDDAISTLQLHSILTGLGKDVQHLYFSGRRHRNGPHSMQIQHALKNFSFASMHCLDQELHHLRIIKSPAEIAIMRAAGAIGALSMVTAMQATAPGVSENSLDAVLEFSSRSWGGANLLPYAPVVAGGVRATTLHYVANDQILRDSELVLVDSGADYRGYASDITRTWPVSGTFTEPQAKLYDAVLNVLLAVTAACESCAQQRLSLGDLQQLAVTLMTDQLKHIGLISSSATAAEVIGRTRRLFPHAISHFLGMDVHDTSSRPMSTPLREGMVFTIEPGIYVPDSDEFPKEYRGLGVRIEDDIAISERGYEVLTESCPKTIEDVEAVLATGRSA